MKIFFYHRIVALQNILSRPALLTIYKCFIRPHLDYGDIIYGQAYSLSFHNKLKFIQYNAALALKHIFPSAIIEWNRPDPSPRYTASCNVFQISVLKFIRPSPNRFFQCQNSKRIKLVTRLRLGLSHLREHKFKHNRQDTFNLFCRCDLDIETTSRYFLHCPLFHAERYTLTNNIKKIGNTIRKKATLFFL